MHRYCFFKFASAPPVIEKDVPNMILPMDEMVRFKIYFSGTAPFTHQLTLNKEPV